jgi:hypothetical protein
MSENRVLKRILGPKRKEVTGGWRKLYDEKLYNLHSSSNINVIKSRRMSWARHVAHMGEIRNAHTQFYLEGLKDRNIQEI